MKLEKKCLILALAAAALFGGCGERDDDDWERADRTHRYEPITASLEYEPLEFKPVESKPVEESKPLHNFNLARDAVFWYEYDANGELATIKTRIWFNQAFYSTRSSSPPEPSFILTDAEYAEDGNLVSLKAADDKYKLEAQYSTDGRIDSVKVARKNGSGSLEVTYNDSTGFVYVVGDAMIGWHVKAELDSLLNITYCEIEEEGLFSETKSKLYYEYYDTNVVAKHISYENNIKRSETTYYDNGKKNEVWLYNNSGKLYHHIQYDRSGNILIDEDGNGKPFKY